jgi:hypothetical protein
MSRHCRVLLLAACVGAVPVRGPGADSSDAGIQKLLSARCVVCHNSRKPASGLSLESTGEILRGGSLNGPAAVPGHSADSPLIQYLRGEKKPQMPLGGAALTEADITLIARWIDAMKSPQAVSSRQYGWPFSKLEAPPVPSVRNRNWVETPVDAFVLSKLEQKGMVPAPPVSRRVLLRRLYFDLIGIPPTPADVDRFENDPRPDAYDREIDKLLADPRYGERWGRHWLDLVRYADSGGGGLDYAWPHMWRYRDYVIRAFNQDRPYDRFIKEQLAGDAYQSYGAEGRIGLGYLRLGVFVEGTGEELRRDLLIDLVNTTGSVFLGVTLGCARCHDHKYDPIPTRDYYRMEAFFAPVKVGAEPLPFTQYEHAEAFAARKKAWQAILAERKAHAEKVKAEFKRRVENARILASPQDLKDLAVPVSDAEVSSAVAAGILFTKAEQEKFQLVHRQEARFANPNDPNLYEPVVYTASESLGSTNPVAPTTYVLKGGNMNARGEPVEPGFLSAAAGNAAADLTGLVGTRRKLLAEWIASPANPLTARVMVNRIWQHHFGKGLVATPSDFGRNGSGTVHPELIDWLASQFIENGWSVKAMHRLILRSNTYRQAMHNPRAAEYEKLDPERRYLWQMNALRLEGEALRDSILAVSGRLNPEMGGPAFFPDVADDLLKRASTWWEPSPPNQRHRRSVYMLQQRSFVFPMLSVFDGANLNETCALRSVTTVTPQVFSLMNSRFAEEESQALADRLTREAGADPEKRVERAFRLAFQRAPSSLERSKSLEFLRAGSLRDLCLVLFNMNEFAFLE